MPKDTMTPDARFAAASERAQNSINRATDLAGAIKAMMMKCEPDVDRDATVVGLAILISEELERGFDAQDTATEIHDAMFDAHKRRSAAHV